MKVKAKNETIARLIKHPNGAKFNAEGIAFWPPDQFTTRRIRDGDVTVIPEPNPAVEPPRHARQSQPAAKRSEQTS